MYICRTRLEFILRSNVKKQMFSIKAFMQGRIINIDSNVNKYTTKMAMYYGVCECQMNEKSMKCEYHHFTYLVNLCRYEEG